MQDKKITYLLSDEDIIATNLEMMIEGRQFIEPFEGNLVNSDGEKKLISYGLSSFGYDIRCTDEFMLAVPSHINNVDTVLDPKEPDTSIYKRMEIQEDKNGRFVVMPPNSFALSSSFATLDIPEDIMVVCIGKSTYARVGVVVPITPLEPGWKGQITLEFSNTSSVPVRIYVNEGVAQLLFYKQSAQPNITYADRNGKYQNQTGITLPRG